MCAKSILPAETEGVRFPLAMTAALLAEVDRLRALTRRNDA
jgi:hypothetical protein